LKGKRKKKMRNTYLDENECKKKMEWQGVSTHKSSATHTKGEKRKRLGFFKREKERKRGER